LPGLADASAAAVQLIMDKTIADHLSGSEFTTLISVTLMKKGSKFIAVPQISSKTGKQ